MSARRVENRFGRVYATLIPRSGERGYVLIPRSGKRVVKSSLNMRLWQTHGIQGQSVHFLFARGSEGVGMATKERLRSLTTARPFQPFVIKMASGERFTIKHPENAACDERGRNLVVFSNGMHLVEMLLVEVMEPAVHPAPGENGP